VLPEAQLAAMLRPLLEKQATLQAEIAGHRGDAHGGVLPGWGESLSLRRDERQRLGVDAEYTLGLSLSYYR
jgi:hypothetical protein